MRIAKADSPSEQISQVISELTWTHYKATGKSKQYMYWRTAANAVFSDTLVIFGTGDSSGAWGCLLYTSPSPRDVEESRMPSSA